jgi:hypothetical protein
MALHCTPLGLAFLATHPGAFVCDGSMIPNQTVPSGLFPELPNPWGGGGVPFKPNIDPTCLGVDCQPPVAQPPTGGGTGTGTGTGGNSTSPLDSLAAQLMGGGSGSGGGLTAAPVTVPAAGGGVGLGMIVLVLAAAGIIWFLLKGRKGTTK